LVDFISPFLFRGPAWNGRHKAFFSFFLKTNPVVMVCPAPCSASLGARAGLDCASLGSRTGQVFFFPGSSIRSIMIEVFPFCPIWPGAVIDSELAEDVLYFPFPSIQWRDGRERGLSDESRCPPPLFFFFPLEGAL